MHHLKIINTFFWKIIIILSKLWEELQNGINILVGPGVIDENMPNIVFINNYRMLMPFLSF